MRLYLCPVPVTLTTMVTKLVETTQMAEKSSQHEILNNQPLQFFSFMLMGHLLDHWPLYLLKSQQNEGIVLGGGMDDLWDAFDFRKICQVRDSACPKFG